VCVIECELDNPNRTDHAEHHRLTITLPRPEISNLNLTRPEHWCSPQPTKSFRELWFLELIGCLFDPLAELYWL
jgi:hypothetical protein